MDAGTVLGLATPVVLLSVVAGDLWRLDKGMLIAASPLLALCASAIAIGLYRIVS